MTRARRYNTSDYTMKLVGVAMFAAVIVVVQWLMTFVIPGVIPLNLVLPVIVAGAALYGAKSGLALGLFFSAVVISSAFGQAYISTLMMTANPVLMVFFTVLRGGLTGFVAGYVYKIVSKKDVNLGVLSAAVIAPIINTGIFAISVMAFQSSLYHIAGENNLLYHVLIVMAGTNFIIEMATTIGLVTVVTTVIRAVSKSHKSEFSRD